MPLTIRVNAMITDFSGLYELNKQSNTMIVISRK